MNVQKMGQVLYALRMEKELKQESLCYGLCSKGVYSKYEYGKQSADRLLLNVLMQRLGKNPDKLMMALTKEEHRYFIWKRQVLTALEKIDMETVTGLLGEAEAV